MNNGKYLSGHFRKEIRFSLILLFTMLCGCVWIFRDYLFGNKIMVFTDIGSDTLNAYIGHFCTVIGHIQNGTFTFYDLNFGLGTNLFCLNLFDPFFALTILIGLVLGTAHMLIYLVAVHILKILAAGFLFSLFLKEHSLRPLSRWTACMCYAFSGYLLLWGQHYEFGTSVVYLPLLLLAAERFLKGKKGGCFLPAAVFFSAVYSVYFTYMSLAFLGFYILFRTGFMERISPGVRVRRILSAYLMMLLGLGMGMAVFLPTAKILTDVSFRLSSRPGTMGSRLGQLFSLEAPDYYRTLIKRFLSINFGNIPGGSPQTEYFGYTNYYEDPAPFTSAFTVLACLQYLFRLPFESVSRRKKACGLLGGITILAVVGLRLGGIAFNGFVPATYRYFYVLLPVLLLCAAFTFDRIREGQRISITALAIGTVWMAWGYAQALRDVTLPEHRANVYVQILCGVTMSLVLIGYGIRNRRKPAAENRLKRARRFPILPCLLACSVFVSLIADGAASFEARRGIQKDDEVFFRELYSQDIADGLAWLAQYEAENGRSDPYRVEKDFNSGTHSQDSMIQGYRGISTYNSILNQYTYDFFHTCYPEWINEAPLHLLYWNMPGDGWSAAFMGIRYLFSRNVRLDPEYFDTLPRCGRIGLFENKRESVFGRFFLNSYSEESLKELCNSDTRQVLLGRGIALESGKKLEGITELLDEKAYGSFEMTETIEDRISREILPKPGAPVIGDPDIGQAVLDRIVKDSHVTGTVETAADGYVLLMIPYEGGWALTIDGEKEELLKGDLGFLAFPVQAGTHRFALEFTPPGLKTGGWISAVCWSVYLLLLFAAARARKTR